MFILKTILLISGFAARLAGTALIAVALLSPTAPVAGQTSEDAAGGDQKGAAAEAEAAVETEAEDKRARDDSANLAAQGVLGAGGGGRLLYRINLPWGHRVTGDTLNGTDQQSYNPTYSWNFSPSIIYFADPTTWYFASFGAQLELTDSEFTTTSQELLLGDLSIGMRKQVDSFSLADGHNLLWWVGGGAAFPVSKASDAASRIVSLNVNTFGNWIIADVMQALVVQGSTRFTLNVDADSTGRLGDAAYVCTRLNGLADSECTEGLDPNTNWSWNFGLAAQLIATSNLFASVSAGFTVLRRHALSDVSTTITSGTVDIPANAEPWGQTASIGASVTYLPLSMVGLTLSVQNNFGQVGPTGRYRGPFDANDVFIDLVMSVFIDGTEPTPESP